MKKNKSVCVFCSSSNNVEEKYRRSAKKLAQILSSNNITIIYGGGNTGMMGDLADTCIENKGDIIGVIPQFLKKRENLHQNLTKVYIENNMHSRKMKMYKLSDIFICLPGGYGTLDEFIEVIAWKQLGIHNKVIILINIDNYWSKLLKFFDEIDNKRFTYNDKSSLFKIINKIEEIVTIIN
ncbi:MAG: LOG family protein YvdD [Alphaproteobacteria bacterium MarineAlpha2_Bin1]|nr:MAG: LOG family protein YvdD [Alphaproteobacteria bacterium MarineAlpha2_Bin1]|tara:strand:+ start:48 stop:590 length:543 start_codon:yes stop_codon:yes gene_type:complete